MAFDYAKQAATALKLIGKFGKVITFRQVTVGAYDPATSTSAVTEVDSNRNGCVFDYNLFSKGEQNATGLLIESGDRRLYLDANGDTPTLSDKFIIGGVIWIAKNIKPLNPAGINVMFDIQIRR